MRFVALFILCLAVQCSARRIVVKDGHQKESPSLSFTVLNNCSLPVNILVMPKLARVYAASENYVTNGGIFEFTPVLGAYDFQVTVSDGENGWRNDIQTGWGLTKDGVAIALKLSVGYLAAVSTIGAGAVAVVAATLTAWAWAPTAIIAASALTLAGVAAFSSMTICALTDASMDFAARRIHALREKQDPAEAKIQASKGIEWFKFKEVVTEITVQEAFSKAFPEIEIKHVVMNFATASAYFNSMQSKFSSWAVSKGKPRQFVLAGGFVNPTDLPEMWWKFPDAVKVDFAQLAMGEVKAEHGCQLADDESHWRNRVKDCGAKCEEMILAKNETGVLHHSLFFGVEKSKHKWPVEEQEGLSACTKKCSQPFSEALRQEWDTALRNENLQKGQDKILPNIRYGECWSKCSSTGWGKVASKAKQVATFGGLGAWCHATGDPILPTGEPGAPPLEGVPADELAPQITGRLCSAGDECLDTRDEDDAWACVDSCD